MENNWSGKRNKALASMLSTTWSSYTLDLDNRPVPVNVHPDIGAYEAQE